MVLLKNVIREIKKNLKKYYPMDIDLNRLYNLSHFDILSQDYNNYLPFQFDINGKILNNEYKNYIILKVITTKTYSFNEYLLFYVFLLNVAYNPYINENKFLILLHTYNYIDELRITKLIITNKENTLTINIKYTSSPNYYFTWYDKIGDKIDKENHFYFKSFNVKSNKLQLKNEMMRLFKNRDKYKTIHFHLDNNGGGDNVPAHLILRCLTGKKEKWMKNIIKKLTNKKDFEWDCWKEDEAGINNYNVVQELNLDFIPNYETKYTGKIYLHMNKKNGSAAWFFITYLIYAFADKIIRYNQKSFNQTIKLGYITSNQLVLKGFSGTTSGDCNSKNILYDKINIYYPTQQFISCSINKRDWNRFWHQTYN